MPRRYLFICNVTGVLSIMAVCIIALVCGKSTYWNLNAGFLSLALALYFGLTWWKDPLHRPETLRLIFVLTALWGLSLALFFLPYSR